LIIAVKITGPEALRPMAWHWLEDGHVTWVIPEIGVVPTSGNSAPSGPPGAPKRNTAPVVVPDVPTPETRHFGVLLVIGQTIDDSELTVTVVGVYGSTVQVAVDPVDPIPVPPATEAFRTIGLDANPVGVPVPMAMQLVAVGQITCVKAVAVNPVKMPAAQVPLGEVAGPETMTGEPTVAVVATATHPLLTLEHCKLETDVRVGLLGKVSSAQLSLPAAPMVPVTTTALPELLVPAATQSVVVDVRQLIWVRLLTPVGGVSAVSDGEVPVDACRITDPVVP
jgi:hypothetical protein